MVDVRTPEEQDVSIIPNSIRQDVFDPKNYEDHMIVAYCTIGCTGPFSLPIFTDHFHCPFSLTIFTDYFH
jgi:hypothetical protein